MAFVRAPPAVIGALRRVDLRLLDALVALLLSAGAMLTLLPYLDQRLTGVIVPSALAATTTVAWRRWSPLLASIVAVLAVTALTSAQTAAANASVLFEPAAMALDYFLLGRTTRSRSGVPAAALGLAVAVLVPVGALRQGGQAPADLVSGLLIFIVLPFAAGYALTRWQRLVSARADAVIQLALEQRLRAEEAAAEERMRIARELHDAIANSLSLMVIHTAGAGRALPHDRMASHAALEIVVESGREALEELRRIVGAVRPDDVIGAGAPGFEGLDALLTRTRAAGVPVSLAIEGAACALPAALDSVVYRVIQEALTNALKHAGATEVSVRLSFAERSLDIEVSDTGGSSSASSRQGSGLGLRGMRERVMLYGGGFHAAPRPEGGYRVSARLPLSAVSP